MCDGDGMVVKRIRKRSVLALARSHAGEVHTSARSSDCRPPWYWLPPSPPELEVDCEGAARLLGRGTYDTLRPRRGRLVLMTFRTARVRPEPSRWQSRSKFFVLPQALYESLEPKFYFRAESRLTRTPNLNRKAAQPVRLCPAPGKPCEAYWSGSVDLPNCTQSTQSVIPPSNQRT